MQDAMSWYNRFSKTIEINNDQWQHMLHTEEREGIRASIFRICNSDSAVEVSFFQLLL